MTDYTLGFIGGGNMASSLIGGLVPDTLSPRKVLVGEPDAEKRSRLEKLFGISGFENNVEVIEAADVIIVAVKPQIISEVLRPLAEELTKRQPLIISIVAGIRTQSFNILLGNEHALIRVMPNTPALVGRGASGLYASPGVSEGQKIIAETLMGATGITEWVDTESDIDTVTALSGSGPAYFMLFMKALSDAAVAAGLDEQTARRLTIETAAGAAELARPGAETLDELIRKVTSPGGTTERALKSFNKNEFTRIVGEALEAARTRSEQIAVELAPVDTNRP
jgi:pyrroline-5-carboxylate reductase